MRRYDLKTWRMRKELTQDEVAAVLGISTGHYRGIENGRYDPSQKLVKKFMDVFMSEECDKWTGLAVDSLMSDVAKKLIKIKKGAK